MQLCKGARKRNINRAADLTAGIALLKMELNTCRAAEVKLTHASDIVLDPARGASDSR